MEMVVTAAGTAVSNVVEMIGTVASPSVQNAAMKVQWYGPLPSLHLSPCHPFLLITSTSSTRQMCRPSPKHTYTSLAPNASSRSATASQGTRSLSTTPFPSRSPPADRQSPWAYQARSTHRLDPNPSPRAMLNAGWPALLAALSFLLTTKLSDPLFGDIVGASGARPRNRVPCTAHAARRVPHRFRESRLPTTHRRCAR